MQVKVSPIFDPWYYEFYLRGLIEYYGEGSVTFSYDKEFTDLIRFSNGKFAKDFFYYTVDNKSVLISAEDWTDVNEELYNCVDAYAKVNLTQLVLDQYPKLFPIGPGFGIRYHSLFGYSRHVLRLYSKAGIKNPYNRVFLVQSLKRSFPAVYEEEVDVKSNYIFYINYPWNKHTAITEGRRSIIQKLKQLAERGEIEFEGGFSIGRMRGAHKGFEDTSATKTYNHGSYIHHLKQSTIAINTPAVHNCLGWKLGEYLALGKVILSTPIDRVLPGDFRKGVHFHEFTDVNADFESSVKLLLHDREYARDLAHHAKTYYDNYLKPVRVIERIHQQLF